MTLISRLVTLAEDIGAQVAKIWRGDTYVGDLDDAPFGLSSFAEASVTHHPGLGNAMVITMRNEDDSARAQLAYSLTGTYAIRYRLGGSWGAWSYFYAGHEAWSDITGKPSTFTPSSHMHAITDITSLEGTLDDLAADVAAAYTLPGTGIPVSDLSDDANTVGVMIWQTYGLHAVGVGQQDIGYVVPFAMQITSVRYWVKTAGTGGTAAVELRKNGVAGGNTISGSSATPSTSPSAATPAHNLSAGDRLWVYQTAVNSTTLGVQLAAEIVGRRL